MTYDVVVRRVAELDILEAEVWYEEQKVGLGAEFRHEVDRALERIRFLPHKYPIVHRGLHRAGLRRFPYLIYFLVEE